MTIYFLHPIFRKSNIVRKLRRLYFDLIKKKHIELFKQMNKPTCQYSNGVENQELTQVNYHKATCHHI